MRAQRWHRTGEVICVGLLEYEPMARERLRVAQYAR
jgi:hypothetical protein